MDSRTVFKHLVTFEQAVGMTWEADWPLPRIDEFTTQLTAESAGGLHIDAVTLPDVLEDASRWYRSDRLLDGQLRA